MMMSFVHVQMEHMHTEEYTSDINTHLTGETFGCYCLAHLEQRKSVLHLGAIKQCTSRYKAMPHIFTSN